MAETWIVVGDITAPQGVRGEVRVFPVTDFPERLTQMRVCLIKHHNGNVTSYNVQMARPHKGYYLLQLEGVTDRDAAEKLRNTQVVIPRSDVKPLPEGRFYIFDLLGMQVFTNTDEYVGVVKDVLPRPGNDIYVIRRENKPDVLVPAVHQIVATVDVQNRKMVIVPLPGLLDELEGEPE